MSRPDLATVVRNYYSRMYPEMPSTNDHEWIYQYFWQYKDNSLFEALNAFFKNYGCDIFERQIPLTELLKYNIEIDDIYDHMGDYYDLDDDLHENFENDETIIYNKYGNATGSFIDYKKSPYELLLFVIEYIDECAEGIYELEKYIQQHPELNSSALSEIFSEFHKSHNEFYQHKALKQLHLVSKDKKTPHEVTDLVASYITGQRDTFNNKELTNIDKNYNERFKGFKENFRETQHTDNLDLGNNEPNKKTRKQKKKEWWKQRKKQWFKKNKNTNTASLKKNNKNDDNDEESYEKMGVGGKKRKTYKKRKHIRKKSYRNRK